jgi:hypothetical protein
LAHRAEELVTFSCSTFCGGTPPPSLQVLIRRPFGGRTKEAENSIL